MRRSHPRKRHGCRLALAAVLSACAFLPLGAQGQNSADFTASSARQMPAQIVADSVTLRGQMLTARGHVSAFADGTRLDASEIRYDGARDRMEIVGPLVLTQPDGTIMTATRAQLDPRFEAGILLGARLVLDRRVQLAAARADRAGPLTQLDGVAVTSCAVCPGQAPLWEIRARRVTHDSAASRLWFEGAQMRVRGVPVLWLPTLSLPLPEAARARGLLVPSLTSSSRLGTGLKLPYFVPLGDHRDVTISPWISRESSAVELRYRQAFANGDLSATFLVADDTFDDTLRTALMAEAQFRLPNRFQLEADLELVSDDQVPFDYDYDAKARLDSALSLTRVTARHLTQAQVTGTHTRRDDESNDTIASLTFGIAQRGRRPYGDAMLSWDLSMDGYHRRADTPGIGRDGLRAGAEARAAREWITGPGLVLRGEALLRADAFALDDAALGDEEGQRLQAGAKLGFSWPLIRHSAQATHVIEPQATLIWSEAWGAAPPNEDSTRLRFDESTLHAFRHAPGEDLVETGARLALGADWTMQTNRGTTTRLSFGRILRADAAQGVTTTSGLSGERSDWLLGAYVALPDGFSFGSRVFLSDEAEVTTAESRIEWDGAQVSLSAAHLYLSADSVEARPHDISELTLETEWATGGAWDFSAEFGYDLIRERGVSAKLGAVWRNECVLVGISASRRFSTFGNVGETTSFGLNFALEGFQASAPGLRRVRSCRP